MGIEQKKKIRPGTTAVLKKYLDDVPPLLMTSGHSNILAYTDYLSAVIHKTLNDFPKSILFADEAEGAEGFALLRLNEWDSNYFNIPIGYIDHFYFNEENDKSIRTRVLLNRCLDMAREWGIELLYVNVGASRFPLIKEIGAAGFQFIFTEINGVYGRQELARAGVDEVFSKSYALREYRQSDSEAVLAIGAEFSRDIVSKYTLTPWLSKEKARHYYLQAVKNACRNRYGDIFYVLLNDDKICGFNIIKADTMLEKKLNKFFLFCALFGLRRSERKYGIGTRFSSASQQKLYQEKGLDFYLWKAPITNKPLIDFIFRRDYTPHIEFIHTFCIKL